MFAQIMVNVHLQIIVNVAMDTLVWNATTLVVLKLILRLQRCALLMVHAINQISVIVLMVGSAETAVFLCVMMFGAQIDPYARSMDSAMNLTSVCVVRVE